MKKMVCQTRFHSWEKDVTLYQQVKVAFPLPREKMKSGEKVINEKSFDKRYANAIANEIITRHLSVVMYLLLLIALSLSLFVLFVVFTCF